VPVHRSDSGQADAAKLMIQKWLNLYDLTHKECRLSPSSGL
jgi:hypothetical protein